MKAPFHRLRLVRLLLLALSTPLSAAGQDFAPDPVPHSLIDFTLAALDHHPVIGVGEVHESGLQFELLAELMASPRMRGRVQDVVVEFGNALYQPTLDRYLLDLEDVHPDSLELVWSEHSESPTGPFESPIYADFVHALRAINQELPGEERFRVVAADRPIEWSRIQTAEDYRALPARSRFMGERVIAEVLERGRRALVVIGGAHLSRSAVSPVSGRPLVNVTSVVEETYPGSIYVISGLAGFGPRDPEILPRMAEIALGDVIPLAGHFLGEVPAPSVVGPVATSTPPSGATPPPPPAVASPRPVDASDPASPTSGLTRSDLFDAYLWLGTPTMVPLVPARADRWSDDARWEELNRRSQLRFGQPLDPASRATGRLRPMGQGGPVVLRRGGGP